MEVVCTLRCGIIGQENPHSEGSGRPVAMQLEPLSERTRRPQSYATSIRTHQAPGAFLADSLRPGAQLLHPTQIFFLLMEQKYKLEGSYTTSSRIELGSGPFESAGPEKVDLLNPLDEWNQMV